MPITERVSSYGPNTSSSHNTKNRKARVRGWKLKDRAGHTYRFPRVRIGGAYVKIHTGSGEDDRNDLYWDSGNFIWNKRWGRGDPQNQEGSGRRSLWIFKLGSRSQELLAKWRRHDDLPVGLGKYFGSDAGVVGTQVKPQDQTFFAAGLLGWLVSR